jgi:glycosyltransferase involved in cell wall biosynthesis
MKIALVTDAWTPQVNGVVTTLVALVDQLKKMEHSVEVIHPYQFKSMPCPGYSGIDLALFPYQKLAQRLQNFQPDCVHIATEGPLGWAARRYCCKHSVRFTTAFHTRFPELLQAALKVPLSWGYALFRRFHQPSEAVMVPTKGMLRILEGKGFQNLKPWTHGVDTELFQFAQLHAHLPEFEHLKRPIALCVGRVSYEKNVEAFLQMPWHGNKVVCGEGPLLNTLKQKYPEVTWMGVLDRDKLASVYAAADVFVMPSRHETFGLVMLEAMSCGTPVAAYPVDGPLEVLQVKTSREPLLLGGCLNDDLYVGARAALNISRLDARAQALSFSWTESAEQFVNHLYENTQAVQI